MFEEKPEWWQQYGSDLRIMQIDPNFFDQNPYPVIEFRFSQCPNNERFLMDIRTSLNNSIKKYKLGIPEIPESLIGNKFNGVVSHLQFKFDKAVVITVDESDQPLLNQMFDEDLTKDERDKKMNQTIKSFSQFYGSIKDQIAGKLVRMIIIAGHSMIAKTNIYSGFFSLLH